MTLSRRETLLIFGLASFVLGALAYFLLSWLAGYSERLGREVERRQIQLVKAEKLTRGLAEFNGNASNRRRRKPLIGNVEQLAARNGLKERIQLNLVPMDKARKVAGIDVKLDNLTLDEMIAFIHAVENTVPPLIMEQVDITAAFRSQDQLRLSVRILAEK